MLFPVKVTKTAANKKHDMTYEKNFNPNGIVKILETTHAMTLIMTATVMI